MTEPIKVGDLVVLVKTCCDALARHPVFGAFKTVIGFRQGHAICLHCGWKSWITWAELSGGNSANIAWLKRIPPLAELESEQRKEELTA